MSPSFLVVDADPRFSQAIADQLGSTGGSCQRAASLDAAKAAIADLGATLTGMVTAIDIDGEADGWEIARLARQTSPAAIIGYRGVAQRSDWLRLGVPNSIVLGMSIEDEIGWAFLGRDPQHAAITGRWSDRGQFKSSVEPAAADQRFDPVDPHFEPGDSAAALDPHMLYALFEKAPSFMAFLDGPEHRYTFANQAYLEVVERKSVVGQTVVEAFPEAIAQGFVDLLDHVYRTGETFRAHGIEFRVHRLGDGMKTTYLDLIYHPMRTAGKVTGIFVEGVDITERHKAQEKIAALQEELIHVARVNALGTLVSALAHELNQPLTSIQNYMTAASMHAERDHLQGPIVQCLTGTAQAALRAGDVIRKLREMASRRASHRQEMSLEPSMRETVALASVGRFDCSIEVGEVADALILADRIQIQQVLLNLIQNAIEAGGDGPCSVTLSAVDRGQYLEVEVRDTGPGIPDELLRTLFDSFVTTKPDGMGVGLSICRTIIEAHGGTISARNHEAGGASVCFTLPKAGQA